jgi:hypothetical protein
MIDGETQKLDVDGAPRTEIEKRSEAPKAQQEA